MVDGSIQRLVLRPLFAARSAARLRNLVLAPQPVGVARGSALGEYPDHVLVVGEMAAAGSGVTIQALALPGALARALARRTGRGAEVEVVPDVPAWIRYSASAPVKPWLYDLVVVASATDAASRLWSPRRWQSALEALIEHLVELTSDVTELFVLGTVPRSASTAGLFAEVAEWNARALDGVSKLVCSGRSRVAFLPLPSQSSARPAGGPDRAGSASYEYWAEAVADRIAPALDGRHAAHLSAASANADVGEDPESARQRAVDELRIVDTEPDEAMDAIVAGARRVFQTSGAAFSVIDRDREWHKSRSGEAGVQVPRSHSFCSVTIGGWGPLVVPDALQDPRFEANAQVVGDPYIRFYAGYPIESPSGERIGALCVFDPEPRADPEIDRVVLRELARLLQREIWQNA